MAGKEESMVKVLAPSILSADFGCLQDQIRDLEDGGARYVHFDVMDGHFVPEISFGEPVLRSVRRMTDLKLDVHLMVTDPEDHIEKLAEAGADSVTFHLEAMPGGNAFYGGEDDFALAEKKAEELICRIHGAGMEAGISIKPNTPVESVEKLLDKVDLVLLMTVEPGFGGQKYIPASTERIRRLREMAESRNPGVRIEVDGGIKTGNVREALEAGADMIVAGSAVLGGKDAAEKTRAFMDILNA